MFVFFFFFVSFSIAKQILFFLKKQKKIYIDFLKIFFISFFPICFLKQSGLKKNLWSFVSFKQQFLVFLSCSIYPFLDCYGSFACFFDRKIGSLVFFVSKNREKECCTGRVRTRRKPSRERKRGGVSMLFAKKCRAFDRKRRK